MSDEYTRVQAAAAFVAGASLVVDGGLSELLGALKNSYGFAHG